MSKEKQLAQEVITSSLWAVDDTLMCPFCGRSRTLYGTLEQEWHDYLNDFTQDVPSFEHDENCIIWLAKEVLEDNATA